MNNDDVYSKLITAYKNAKTLIKETPNNKENIIKEYIDLVIKFTNNTSQYLNNQNQDSTSPTDISIYNTFNPNPNDMNYMNMNMNNNRNNNRNNYIDITKTSNRSIQELASTFNYINK